MHTPVITANKIIDKKNNILNSVITNYTIEAFDICAAIIITVLQYTFYFHFNNNFIILKNYGKKNTTKTVPHTCNLY